MNPRRNPFFPVALAYIAGLAGYTLSFWMTGTLAALLWAAYLMLWIPSTKEAGADTLQGAKSRRRLRLRWRLGLLPPAAVGAAFFLLGQGQMRQALAASIFPVEAGGGRVQALVRWQDPPRIKERSVQGRVRVESCPEEACWEGRSWQLALARDSASIALQAGDLLEVNLKPRPLKAWEGGDPSFDYLRYLQRRGVCASAYLPADRWRISPEERFSVRRTAGRAKGWLLHRYGRCGLKPRSLALASALTLGHKDGLDQATREQFASAGIAHILAVSGMHVGILASALSVLLCWTKRRLRLGWVKSGLSLAVLWSFALVSGLPASVVRAVCMFTVAEIGLRLRRRCPSWNNLAFAAFVLLWCRPLWWWDIGFQLSFSAVAGILWLQPYFVRMMPPLPGKLLPYFAQLFCLSLAAQIGTAPLSVYYFQQFPNYFWLSNLIMVPLACAVCLLSFAVLALGPLAWFKAWLVPLLDFSVDGFCALAAFFDSLPGAVSRMAKPSVTATLAAYLLMALMVGLCREGRLHYDIEHGLYRLSNRRYRNLLKPDGEKRHG